MSGNGTLVTQCEEAANFKSAEVFDQTNPTFIRQKSPWVDQVPVFYTYNPPRNPYDWVNEWVDQARGDDDYFIDTSTYLDDELGITTGQQLRLIDKYKANDYDYYRWLYLGEVIGLGTNIYNMALFHTLDELPSDDELAVILIGADVGHMASATAVVAVGVTAKGNIVVLDTYYYSPAHQAVKKAPDELSSDIHAFIETIGEKYPDVAVQNLTIDSAEGAMRNQYYKDYHIRWHPVRKGKEADMIDYVQNVLAQGRVYVMNTENNKVFIDEHRRYQWDEKSMNTDELKVIKVDDHTVDAFKYTIIDNARLLGLKR